MEVTVRYNALLQKEGKKQSTIPKYLLSAIVATLNDVANSGRPAVMKTKSAE